MMYKILCILFGVLLYISFICFANYHYNIIACPYPLEYREGANILPTDLLLQGKNPFDCSNNPQSCNIYGIFYNLLLFPLAKIWGPTLLLHRIVAGFFLFACCLIIVALLRKNKIPPLLSLAGGLLLYPFLLFPRTTTPCAGPHTLGLFLFLITFFIPYLLNYSKISLIISLLSGLLAFYTKPYFLLAVFLTTSYIFLFKSKKNGFLYGLTFLAVFILSIYIVNHTMDCYFNNIFWATFNATGVPSVSHAIEELKYFYQFQKPLFLLMGICLIIQTALYIKNRQHLPWEASLPKINFSLWQEPLLKWNFNIHLYGLLITSLTIYFLLGRNNGQLMGYPFQLMSPFFILYIFNCLYKQRFTTLISAPLIISTLFTLYSIFPKDFHEFDPHWFAVEDLVATHKNIFISPLLDPLLIKYHQPVMTPGTQNILN